MIIAGDDHVYERSFPRFEDTVAIPSSNDVSGTDTLITDTKVVASEDPAELFF